MEQQQGIDPYKLLRVLDETTRHHASTVKALNRALNRLRHDVEDEELQAIVLHHLRKLRIIRQKILRSLGEDENIDLGGVDENIISSIATLSEYMIIVGAEYERDLLRKARSLAKKGARLINAQLEDIRNDEEELERLVDKLQQIVDKYY